MVDVDHDPDSERPNRGGVRGSQVESEDECELCDALVLDIVGCDTCGHEILCDSCLTSHDCDDGFDWGDSEGRGERDE